MLFEGVVGGAVSRLDEGSGDEDKGWDREIAGDRYLELSSLLLVDWCC